MKEQLYTNNIRFDFDSMEIIYFFIPEYNISKKQGFYLHQKYKINLNKYSSNLGKQYLKIEMKEKADFLIIR